MKYLFMFVFIFIIIVFIGIPLFRSYKTVEELRNMHKPKTHSPNIILMGDYVLHEPKTLKHYTLKHPSIRALLQKMYPLAKIKEVSSNCATLDDLTSQINQIPKNWNSINTVAFMSIGSNDIYQNIINCNAVFKDEPIGSINASSKKLECLNMGDIEKKWQKQIKLLQNKFPNIKIVLLGSYYPKKGSKI